jgi:two-component system chemotaxis response regulator CheY
LARKILLADDSVTAQNMGRKILADAGYEVITVNNGSAALKKINELRPDVIVLDVYMPGYSGLEVCQRLKETGETSRIPILLTVGKLEPFKPEEAKRVRADGFIVKPFEASELLSALTRLEDKIVPRNETSKPGRFSRAIASIEDPLLEKSVPFDKTMSVEEDSSWKNRISFPTKAKKKEADDERVYEQASKDRRSVIDKAPEAARAPEGEKVDLSALAPAGLPKDVTPEEIAALAAAAARVKGKVAEPAAEMPVVAPPERDRQNAEDSSFEEYARVIPTPAPAASVAAPVESKVVEPPNETISANEAKTSEAEAPAKGDSDTSLPAAKSEPEDEPVTIAAAAMAVAGSASSRWTAVSVALTPEETGISLEQEMQKAYAAYAAAETGHSGGTPVTTESASLAPSSTVETVASDAPLSVPATTAPDAVQPLSAVASAATEAVAEAVKELQKVAESFADKKAAEPIPIATIESQAMAPVEPVAREAILDSQTAPPMMEELQSRVAEEPAAQIPAPVAASETVTENTMVASASSAGGTASNEPGQAASEVSEGSTGLGPEIASEMANKQPDVSATTAAAWDSWKRVQESGHDNGSSPENAPSSTEDKAAMAAAVGGKHALEELTAAAENDPAIASIVDSVLADLRPKIVEEISRKLGKKK